jgi:diguanylate cyclase (GGDEF)-like protein/putative nucleotidyltransferase with HDIG domain
LDELMQKLSWQAKAYITFMLLAGILVLISNLPNFQDQNVGMVLTLGLAAGATQIFKVEGSTAKSSYNISLFLFGFTFYLLGPPSAILVMLISHLIEWIRNKYPWYIQFFNITSYAVVISAAALTNEGILSYLPVHDMSTVLALIISMLVFVFLNHLSTGLENWLVSGESLKQSEAFNNLSLMIDLTLLCLGIIAVYVWPVNAYSLLFTLAPLVLFYSTLRLPKLEHKARLEPKTGLYNSRHFEEALQKELSRAKRFNRPLTIAMADMDFLREINNTYGHLAGDAVLQGVAEVLRDSFREYDVVARFGGEEFVILMPEVAVYEAHSHINDIRSTIEKMSFVVSTSVSPIQTTISFGLSGFEFQEQSARDIIHNADVALYQAKMEGRNRVSTYLESDHGMQWRSSRVVSSDNSPPKFKSNTAKKQSTEEPHESTKKFTAPTSSKTKLSNGVNGLKPRKSHYSILFTGSVALIGLTLLVVLNDVGLQPDWVGISIFAVFVLLTEWFSIEIYVKRTTVSTSVVPFIAGVLLFGPFAAVVYAVVIAGIGRIKSGAYISRFIFNFSNHLITALIVTGITRVLGSDFQELSVLTQIIVCILAGAIVYFCSTVLISVAIDLDKGQPFSEIWNERFRWLAPSYLLMGVLIYFLIFSYLASGILGILVVAGPLMLLRHSQTQFVKRTGTAVNELRSKNEELVQRSYEIDNLNESLLQTLAKVIDYRDPYVYGHSEYVAHYSSEIAEELNLPTHKVQVIYQAGLLHDIGKLGVPERVLLKPGILTEEEYEAVKQHSLIGAELLGSNPSLQEIIPWVLHHHERYDGQGYPGQLAAAEIPFEARILALADAVDSMASDRPYRKALDPGSIMDELRRNEGLQFDPRVMEAFFRIIQRKGVSFLRNSASEIPTREPVMQWAVAR